MGIGGEGGWGRGEGGWGRVGIKVGKGWGRGESLTYQLQATLSRYRA